MVLCTGVSLSCRFLQHNLGLDHVRKQCEEVCLDPPIRQYLTKFDFDRLLKME